MHLILHHGLTRFPIRNAQAKYLWPKGKPGLKARIVLALGFLVGAKVCGVYETHKGRSGIWVIGLLEF